MEWNVAVGAFANKGQKQPTNVGQPTVLKGHNVSIQNLIFTTKHLSSNESQKLLNLIYLIVPLSRYSGDEMRSMRLVLLVPLGY